MIWNISKKQLIRTVKRKNNPKNEDSISSLCDNFKRFNIHIIGMPDGEKKSKKLKFYLKK